MGIYGNSIIEESENDYIINILKINSPNKLSDWMKSNIKYSNFSKLMSAEDVYNKRKGSCHDQVMLEKYWFKHKHFQTTCLFCIEYNDGENIGGSTHSFLIYNEKDKYYWFENAWESEKGIHGAYNSIKEIKEDVKNKMLKNNNGKYKKLEFGLFKNIKPGMSLNDIVNKCLE